MLPSADHIAAAIVAACRETGDSPFDVVNGVMRRGPGEKSVRGRHYAMHALREVFPDLGKSKAAWFVGAPRQNLSGFYNNSFNCIAKVVDRRTGRRVANWWKEEGYQRVILAIRAVGPGVRYREIDPEPNERAPRREPVKLSGAIGAAPPPPRPSGKIALEEMLKQAVQNTARLPVGK